ncbi:hypothetical protein Glove_320g153 [Diversispora epigaea]|uniref:Protein kinase domain-containing protein n=1 Tax=Diversispora epigaea TaxID=1348612 RepID=A0A397HNK6_9GLOM|nr:hypothetical protein Glove_320g153 [Diversispora epigaea]
MKKSSSGSNIMFGHHNNNDNKKYDLLPSFAISALFTSFSNLTTSSSLIPGTAATRSTTGQRILGEVTAQNTFTQLVSIAYTVYGITQDPETHSFMMGLQHAKDGNLREYLKNNFNNINWKKKLFSLQNLSENLRNIPKLNIVHHPGNILSSNFKDYSIGEEYTKAADVYSFGIIACELITGPPPYLELPYDKDLAMKICN